jgi:hypothetical protein
MRSAVLSSLVALLLAAGTARAADTSNGVAIQGCLEAASRAYHVPPAILVILLNVEGGSLGAVSHNTNGTVDIGPMQVNQIWVPQVAAHWSTTKDRAYRALRDNFCANLEAGAWILRQGLDEAHGDFWEGVGTYHSHDPGHKQAYLRSVLQQVLRLRPHQPADLRSVAQQIIPLLPYRPAPSRLRPLRVGDDDDPASSPCRMALERRHYGLQPDRHRAGRGSRLLSSLDAFSR